MKTWWLITKQGLGNIKQKWQLYIAYFLFLFFSFLIIFSFFGLAFNFDMTGSGIVNYKYWPGFEIYSFSFQGDDEAEPSDDLWTIAKNNDANSFYGYFKNGAENDFGASLPNLTDSQFQWLMKNIGYNSGFFEISNDSEAPSSDIQQQILDGSENFQHNFLSWWLFSTTNNSSTRAWSATDSRINLDSPLDIDGLLASTYRLMDGQNNPNVLPWQIAKPGVIENFYWSTKNGNFAIKDTNGVAISQRMAVKNHLKLGDKFFVNLADKKQIELHVKAIGVQRNNALNNNERDIWLNPILYNELSKTKTLPRINNWHLYDSRSLSLSNPNDIDNLNRTIFDEQQSFIRKSFINTDPNASLGSSARYSQSSARSFETQAIMYYLLSSVICIILIILIMVVFTIVSKNNINLQQEQIKFLKSLGFDNGWLTYYIGLSLTPFIILSYALGLGFAPFIYNVFQEFTTDMVGFVIPSSYLASGALIGIVIGLFAILFTIGYLLIWNQIRKQSIVKMINSGKWRGYHKSLFDIPAQSKSLLKLNIGKTLELFFISFFTFLVLSVTFMFSQSINSATASNSEFFSPYGAYTAYNEEPGLLTFDEDNTVNNVFNNNSFKPFPEIDFDDLRGWAMDLLSINDLSNRYFNQVKIFANTDLNLNGNNNWEKTLLNMQHFLRNQLTNYYDKFGVEAPEPILNFKNVIFPNDYLQSTIAELSLYGSNSLKTFVNKDNRWLPSLNEDEIAINYYLASNSSLDIGDTVTIDYTAPWNDKTIEFDAKIKAIEKKINDKNEIIINQSLADKFELPLNAIFTTSSIPSGLQYFTLPVRNVNNTGNSWSDYINFNNPEIKTSSTVSSFLLLQDGIKQQTAPYTNLLAIVSIFMVILCLMLLLVVGIMFALENARILVILKTLGYNFWTLSRPLLILFGISLMISYVITLVVSNSIINMSSNFLLDKIYIVLKPTFDFITVGVNIIFALAMELMLGLWIYQVYRKGDVYELTRMEG